MKNILIYALALFMGTGVALSQTDADGSFPVNLVDIPIEDTVVIYETLKGKKVVSEVEDTFKVSLETTKDVSQGEVLWMLEELLRLNGISVIEEDSEPIKLVRVSEGEYSKPVVDSVESRLEKTLDDLRVHDKDVSSMVFKNDNVFQVLNMVQVFTGKTILRGPGLPENIRINYESLEPMSQADAFLILESLLRENGIILVDTGDDCIAALAVK